MKFSLPLAVLALGFVASGIAVYSFAYDPPKESDSTSETSKAATKSSNSSNLAKSKKMNDDLIYNKLTPAEQYVILQKGTDRPGTGKYTNYKSEGTYLCRRCNAPLYNSTHKFESHCGWPSFDDEIKDAVKRQVEADGTGRIEIVCTNCGGHLGHIFEGERYTSKNIRHCVNSTSMTFIAKGKELPKVKRESDEKTEKTPEIQAGDKRSEPAKETKPVTK